jgi:hypothetical protein
VTSWLTAYAVPVAHGVAAAHCAAVSADFDSPEPPLFEPQATAEDPRRTTRPGTRSDLAFMPS